MFKLYHCKKYRKKSHITLVYIWYGMKLTFENINYIMSVNKK